MVRKGKELLSQFFHQFACPVKEAELHFQLPLVHPTTGEVVDVPLRGVIDLIEEGDVLDEFKTSQKSWSASDLPDNVQLTAYAYAYQMLFGHPAKMLRIVNLVRTKNVKIEPMTTERGEADYARLFHLGKEVRKGVTGRCSFPIAAAGCARTASTTGIAGNGRGTTDKLITLMRVAIENCRPLFHKHLGAFYFRLSD